MDSAIYCLIGPEGKVFVKAGADSYADVAATYGLVEAECDKYRVDVPTRRLMADRADPSSAAGARQFVVLHLGSPERLMEFASEGLFPKRVLANLLSVERRSKYLEACAGIEKRYTEACTAKNDPCLESGCSTEGEICLQPILSAADEYQKACAAEWIKLFQIPMNRIDVWKN
jgi:hypothetical protein